MTSWCNGSASDSKSEGCVFKSRRGHQCRGVWDKRQEAAAENGEDGEDGEVTSMLGPRPFNPQPAKTPGKWS